MAQTNINIRMDENLKKQFELFCNELGLTMTTAFNIFASLAMLFINTPSLFIYNDQKIETKRYVFLKISFFRYSWIIVYKNNKKITICQFVDLNLL